MGCLYSLQSPSGKLYLGISSKTAEARWHVHKMRVREGRDQALQRAIRKYGHENFVVRTLVISNNWEYLCDLECKATAAFGTMSPHGYNLTRGGEGVVGTPITDETRRRMSEGQRKRFTDPVERTKQLERAKINGLRLRKPLGHKAPWELKEIAARLKNQVSEAEWKRLRSERIKAAMTQPVVKAKMVACARQRSADPEWRRNMVLMKTGRRYGKRSPEVLARQIAGIRAAWADPVKKAARIERNKIARQRSTA